MGGEDGERAGTVEGDSPGVVFEIRDSIGGCYLINRNNVLNTCIERNYLLNNGGGGGVLGCFFKRIDEWFHKNLSLR